MTASRTRSGAPGVARPEPVARSAPSGRLLLKRATLAAATAFITVNVWTVCPVLAVWVGSRVVGQRQLSATAVGVAIVALGTLACPHDQHLQ